MKIIKKIVVFTLIISLLIHAKVMADPLNISPLELTAEGQVIYFSNLYGIDANIITRVIDCESQWEHSAKGDGGRSNGIGQFQKSTFNRLSKLMGEELDYNSQFDQIKLLTWSIANGHGREWTSFRALENGGIYKFYSKQLGKHFTVVCKP